MSGLGCCPGEMYCVVAVVQEKGIAPLLLPACLRRQLKGGWTAFMVKLITAQSIKHDILLESWIQFGVDKFEGICSVFVAPDK